MTEAEAGMQALPGGTPRRRSSNSWTWASWRAPGRTRTSSWVRPSSSPTSGCSAARCWHSRSLRRSRTVEADRSVHSMHGYFLRPGDANKPITFGVQRLRDGRSFSARRVHAYQEGTPILSMIASFQDEDEGIEHQSAMPAGHPRSRVPAQHGGPAGEVRPPRGTALGLSNGPSTSGTSTRRCMFRPRASKEARERRLDEDLRPDAGRPEHAPRRPGLRQRLHAPGVHPAPARTELDHAGHERGEPGPRHVVAPARPRGRVAAVRPGVPQRPGRPGPGYRQDLQPGRPARGIRGPGGHGPGALGPKQVRGRQSGTARKAGG